MQDEMKSEDAVVPEGSAGRASSTYSPSGTGKVTRVRKKKKHAKKKKGLRIALIVLCILVVLGLAVFGIYNALLALGAQNLQSTPTNIAVPENAVSYDEGKTVKHNGHTYQYNEDVVSICVLGIDRRSNQDASVVPGQCDAVMVMTFDTKTGAVKGITIPRDSMVEVGEYFGDSYAGVDKRQLCLAFAFGDGQESSCEHAVQAVQRVLYNMPINYYLALDMEGVAPLANALGGVSLTALETIPNTDIVEGQDTVLLGSNALRYIQYRNTSVLTSSLGRQERQVQFVKAFGKQALSDALSVGGVSTLVNLFSIASEYSTTNLGVSEFTYLATAAVSNGIDQIELTSLDGEMTMGANYAEFNLDQDSVYQTVLDVYYKQID